MRDIILSGVEEDLIQTITDLEKQLCRATTALMAIRGVAAATIKGHERAYTALSQIDQLARGGLP